MANKDEAKNVIGKFTQKSKGDFVRLEEPEMPLSEPSKSNPLAVVVILIVLALGGAGGFFFISRSNATALPKVEVAEEAKEQHEKGQGETEEGGLEGEASVKEVIELQPFVLNLADKDASAYLRIAMSLGIGETEEKPEPLFSASARNALLAVLTSKTSKEILVQEDRELLREELLIAVNQAVKKPKVHAIYFTELMVQR